MPKKTVSGHKAAGAPAASKESAAKAAFDEYRKRMGGPQAQSWTKGEPKLSFGAPYMPFPQQMFMPGQPGMPPQPFFYGPDMQGMPFPFKEAEGSLFGSIGKMVKLMVGVANAGLAGGLQLMGGLSNGGGCCAPAGGNECCCRPQNDCCCSEGYTDSCCEPCCDPCCRPSVNNCSCC